MRGTACTAAAWLPTAGVEDAVQEAMLRAWRSWTSFGAPSSPAAWMTTIARREAARWRTGPQGRAWAATVEEVPEPAGSNGEALDALDVRRALAELSPADRALIALRYYADLTQAEIARLTGMPEGTVKVRLHRARTKLRGRLS